MKQEPYAMVLCDYRVLSSAVRLTPNLLMMGEVPQDKLNEVDQMLQTECPGVEHLGYVNISAIILANKKGSRV